MLSVEGLRQTIPVRAPRFGRGPHLKFSHPPVAQKPIVWVTGGLGDLLLTLPVVEAIQEFLGEDVVVYTRYPEVASKLSQLDYRDEQKFIPVGADHWITINTLVLYNFQGNFTGFRNPRERDLFLRYQEFLAKDDWEFIVRSQPYMENITGEKAVKLGLDRRTLPFAILGLEPRSMQRHFPQQSRILDERYITVHHGFDSANAGVQGRATKNWDHASWSRLIAEVKDRFAVNIVQLGAPTAPGIFGVDYDMRGKLDLLSALEVLSRTSLHLDTEGGLVHAAHMFSRRSVVLFGPTKREFFEYKSNVNISSGFCGNCWWLEPTWMERCAVGYLSPLCMDRINPAEVRSKVFDELDRLDFRRTK